MKTLLFPTDFSAASENAEMFAVEIVRNTNAKLYLLHVESGEESTSYARSPYETGYEVIVEESPLMRLKTIVEKYLLEQQPYECLIKKGTIPKTIVETAEGLNAELLVLGSKGVQNYQRSNGNIIDIIRKTTCPVLTVPEECVYKPIGNIAYATDLIHKDDQTFNQLAKFARAFDSDLTLLHINVGAKDIPGKSPLKSIPEIIDAIDYDKVESKVIIAPSVIEGIQKYKNENKVDLIAMTSHSDSFLDKFFRDSQVDKIVRWTDIPTLTFSS